MVDQNILNRVQSGICAIGYLDGRPEDYLRDRSLLHIVGTGFLVRDPMVITNRHVIEQLNREQQTIGFKDDQRYLLFGYLIGEKWQEAFCRFKSVGVLANRELDVGFIEFKRRPEPEFKQCVPLVFGDLSSAHVGQPIAAFGYPYGTSMLIVQIRENERIEIVGRFGPVLQRGFISATAPFDDVARAEKFFLDMRIAGGMSGSPIFRPNDGSVIGMVYAGDEGKVFAVALPIDTARVKKWLEARESALTKQP